MALEAQFLIPSNLARYAEPLLRSLARAAQKDGDAARIRPKYVRGPGVLVLYGVGAEDRHRARVQHLRNGHVLIWDLGYFGRKKLGGFSRVSIDRDHPHELLDATAPDPSRWDEQGIALREDCNPEGPIILVGLGRKSRSYLGEHSWEQRTLEALRSRFPGRRIVHRPKPRQEFQKIAADACDGDSPIGQLLAGASLVVARHSNACVDAAIAGVPFECSDGAALWLAQREFTPETRLDFLRRLAWWQWREPEAREAWRFLKRRLECA